MEKYKIKIITKEPHSAKSGLTKADLSYKSLLVFDWARKKFVDQLEYIRTADNLFAWSTNISPYLL